MPLPIPNLDDLSFTELIDEARRLIPVHTRQWTDHNVHDPGITFLELFAWLAETQVYSLNRIGDESHRKFLKLLHTTPLRACPARVDLALSQESESIVPIDRMAKMVARDPRTGEEVYFETDQAVRVLPVALTKVVSFSDFKHTDVTEFNNPNGSFFHAFGERAELGAAMYLGFAFRGGVVAGEDIGFSIYLHEADLPPVGRHECGHSRVHPSAGVDWEYWNGNGWSALEFTSAAGDTVKSLSQSGRLSFRVPEDMTKGRLPFADDELCWTRCQATTGSYEIPPRIDRILLNTVPATQGVTVRDELLPVNSSLPNQTLTTAFPPAIGCIQMVEVDGGSRYEWHEVADFDASTPTDRHFVFDRESGKMSFGDGERGSIPPRDRNISVTYRYGQGEKGNIGANWDWRVYGVDGESIDNVSVTNPFPAVGGRAAETIPEAIIRARQALRTRFRAVTSDDFEGVAKATPGLRVARAMARVTAPNTVTVIVVPHSPFEGAMPSPGFLRTVREHLDTHRLITTRVEVEEPRYARVDVSVTITTEPRYQSTTLVRRIEDALNEFLSPVRGGPDGGGWPPGRNVHRSEVYEVVGGVEGVDQVVALALAGSATDLVIDSSSLVYPGSHSIDIVETDTVCREK